MSKDRLLRIHAVQARTGLSSEDVHARIADGSFPESFTEDESGELWRQSDLDIYLSKHNTTDEPQAAGSKAAARPLEVVK